MSCCADALCPTNVLVRYRDPMQRPAVPAGSDFALSTPGFLKRGIRADSDIGSQAVVVMIDLFEQSGNDLHRRQFPAGYESGKSCSGHEDQVRWHGTLSLRVDIRELPTTMIAPKERSSCKMTSTENSAGIG